MASSRGDRKTRRRQVTLADVARHAGVSPMTVSRVINNDSKVRDTTREKVNEAISKLNYAPNIAARNLAGAGSIRICLLYGNPSSAYLGELLMGALEAASDLGAHLVVERTDESLTPEFIEENIDQNWDALIVPPPVSDVSGIRRLVAEKEFPTAFISSATSPGRANEIRIDDNDAAKQITELLLEKGHTRIAIIKGHPNQTTSEKRFEGYCEALEAADLEIRQDYVEQGFFTYRSGLDAAEKLLSLKERPTAIFASNDDMAAGVLAAAARHGLSVPKDLSVVGFDDSPIASTIWPNLTTIRQPVSSMAAQAVELVHRLAQPNGHHHAPSTIVMSHHLVERDSVAVPPD